MTYVAQAHNLPIAPRKLRLLTRLLRRQSIGRAEALLSLYPHKAAQVLRKALKTAVHNGQLSPETTITAIEVGEGLKLKRYLLFARGVTRPYVKPRSHLRMVFEAKATADKVTNKERTMKTRTR